MLPTKSNLFPTFSRFFDDDWNTFFPSDKLANTVATLPSVNISETADAFTIEVAAPGMKKDDFKIELYNGVLNIKSEQKAENEEKKENYRRKEFSYQSFQRSFNLDNTLVDDDQIEAKYEDGILHLHIPKKEEAKEKPAREIQIS